MLSWIETFKRRQRQETMRKTGYYTHPVCWQHEMGAGHPECPERLSAIQDRLLISGVDFGLTQMEAPEAPLADIELAHDRMYIAALRGMSDRLVEDMQAGGPAYAHMVITPRPSRRWGFAFSTTWRWQPSTRSSDMA
jgi:acetoin utilization deacetylase AcuC-like enzyme